MKTLARLQAWFASVCDDEWEHHRGVTITTMDNPGWHVRIDLSGTPLQDRPFALVTKNVPDDFIAQSLGQVPTPFAAASPLSRDWLICFTKDGRFEGAGDEQALEEILSIFLRFADGAAGR